MGPDHRPGTGQRGNAGEAARQSGRVAPVALLLRPAQDAPATARAAICAGLADHLTEAVLADALLLVAELVTNSVRHAHAPSEAVITVRAELRPDVLRVEVLDGGSGGSVVRRAPDLENGGGFGLNLVETLSADWGVDRSGGTLVWAELARTQTAPKRTTIDDRAARAHSRSDDARADAPALTARALAARRQAAAAQEAAGRARENARHAFDRCARLRAQLAHATRADSDACPRAKAA
jgi:anti-sigma regulatory factor (Ser/Thr protein kinase)